MTKAFPSPYGAIEFQIRLALRSSVNRLYVSVPLRGYRIPNERQVIDATKNIIVSVPLRGYRIPNAVCYTPAKSVSGKGICGQKLFLTLCSAFRMIFYIIIPVKSRCGAKKPKFLPLLLLFTEWEISHFARKRSGFYSIVEEVRRPHKETLKERQYLAKCFRAIFLHPFVLLRSDRIGSAFLLAPSHFRSVPYGHLFPLIWQYNESDCR